MNRLYQYRKQFPADPKRLRRVPYLGGIELLPRRVVDFFEFTFASG